VVYCLFATIILCHPSALGSKAKYLQFAVMHSENFNKEVRNFRKQKEFFEPKGKERGKKGILLRYSQRNG
jgi:hypothetical protein